jgi:hypothetical protein
MIRYYSFQSTEEYSIKQELGPRNEYIAYEAFTPAEVQIQQIEVQERGQHTQSWQGWEREQLQPLLNKHNGSNHHIRDRSIPHRATIIPM